MPNDYGRLYILLSVTLTCFVPIPRKRGKRHTNCLLLIHHFLDGSKYGWTITQGCFLIIKCVRRTFPPRHFLIQFKLVWLIGTVFASSVERNRTGSLGSSAFPPVPANFGTELVSQERLVELNICIGCGYPMGSPVICQLSISAHIV